MLKLANCLTLPLSVLISVINVTKVAEDLVTKVEFVKYWKVPFGFKFSIPVLHFVPYRCILDCPAFSFAHSHFSVVFTLHRGDTSSPTLSAAVRPPRRCSDCFSCPEVRSRDTITPWSPLTSDSGTDYLQAVLSRLPVSQRHSTCVPRRQHQPRNWHHHEAESAFQLINGGRCFSDSLQHDRGSRFRGCCCPCMEQSTIVCHVIVVTVDF